MAELWRDMLQPLRQTSARVKTIKGQSSAPAARAKHGLPQSLWLRRPAVAQMYFRLLGRWGATAPCLISSRLSPLPGSAASPIFCSGRRRLPLSPVPFSPSLSPCSHPSNVVSLLQDKDFLRMMCHVKDP
jgi:hypothetical protein